MNNDHKDILISTIAEGDANPAQWNEVVALAEADDTIWRQIVVAQRDHADLLRLAGRVDAVADRVPAPIDADAADSWPPGTGANGLPPAAPRVARSARNEGPAPRARGRSRHDRPGRVAARGSTAWRVGSGWAVAALVFLALIVNLRQPAPTTGIGGGGGGNGGIGGGGGSEPTGFTAGLIPTLSTQAAFDAYMEQGRAEGRVLSETPRRVLLETRTMPAGEGYELIYLQQVMERTVVPNLYHFRGQNERGQPALVRYEQPIRGTM